MYFSSNFICFTIIFNTEGYRYDATVNQGFHVGHGNENAIVPEVPVVEVPEDEIPVKEILEKPVTIQDYVELRQQIVESLPQTSDENDLLPIESIAVLSTVAIAGASLIKRKKARI